MRNEQQNGKSFSCVLGNTVAVVDRNPLRVSNTWYGLEGMVSSFYCDIDKKNFCGCPPLIAKKQIAKDGQLDTPGVVVLAGIGLDSEQLGSWN